MIEQASTYARKAHKEQRYGDKPFYHHPAQVAKIIKMLCPLDYELQAAAHLHDVLEDTDTTPAQLTEEFGADIAALVFEVTKTGYNEFPNLKTQRAVVLKFADRLANLVNMVSWDEEKQQEYIKKSTFWKA